LGELRSAIREEGFAQLGRLSSYVEQTRETVAAKIRGSQLEIIQRCMEAGRCPT
jgi:hypothetical protein